MAQSTLPTEMREQPHGGALRSGNPGGGGGPLKNRVRRASGELYEETLAAMRELLTEHQSGETDKKLRPNELAKMAEVSGRFGLGEFKEITLGETDALDMFAQSLMEGLPTILAEELGLDVSRDKDGNLTGKDHHRVASAIVRFYDTAMERLKEF